MLTDLQIRNFAIIDRLQVGFGRGFNVLTGETGAGKSIIIDAVGLLLGDRARPDLIRSGEEEATVEAVFDLRELPEIAASLAAAGFEAEDELLVKRVVSRAGKNRVFINGSLATLGQLQPLTGRLLTIYGQHEHQTLQRAETHLGLLDRFGALREDREAYHTLFQRVAALQQELERLDQAERDRQHRLDLITFQHGEIAEARLVMGEDEELAGERLLLQHAERLAAASRGGYEILYGSDGAVNEQLDRVAGDLEELAAIDPALGTMAETLRTSLYQIEEVATDLRSYAERIAFDPERQERVEERLGLIARLKRKYGDSLAGIFAYHQAIGREIEELGDLESRRSELARELAAARRQLLEAGARLSQRRRQAAGLLEQKVEGELQGLAMARARFEVRLAALEQPGPRGLERVEFYIAPNPGEEPKPLARIASGGELSRLMLALRSAAPEGEGIPTLVFDEVDAGIGGTAATAVGEKIFRLSSRVQVLCITHLPQVAAYAASHFRVDKAEQDSRTTTRLQRLEGEARIQEMARMLGGARISDQTLAHARELIRQSTGG